MSRIAHSEPADYSRAFVMRNASIIRILRDSCCPETLIVARAETILHNAIVEAILHEQWLIIVKEHPHAEERQSIVLTTRPVSSARSVGRKVHSHDPSCGITNVPHEVPRNRTGREIALDQWTL